MSNSSSSITSTKSNGRKSCSDFNILSPLLKEPFKKGWKREVVYRAIVGNERRNMCDIYYFTPDGKKLRSGRELSNYLNGTNSSFKLENFTFCREPIGMDVKHEVLRFARSKTHQDEEASKCALIMNNETVRTRPKKVLRRSYQKEDDEEKALTAKESTSKASAPVIGDNNTSSKRNHTRLRNTRALIHKTMHSSDLTLTLHNSSCKSDIGYTSGQSNIEESFKSPVSSASPNQIYEEKTESPVQQSLALTLESPETLREPQPHSLPLITLLPCGTTLVLSDSQIITIISSNINSSITPVRRSETISPKVSLPPVTDLSQLTDLSSVAFLSPKAVTSLNSTKFEQCAKSIPGSTPIRRILLPKTDGFTVPRFLPGYEGQVSLAPFGTVNRKRSYWASIGQAIIEEGLKKAMLAHACPTSGMVEETPVRVTEKRRKHVPKRFQDVLRPPSPTTTVQLTCKDYFALRKQRRQQQLFSQSSVTGSSITSN
ncbi:uncharacterized protein LOC116922522 isoform X4 [Daphnia magna]|uniref:uncharacterized protein LOC116922522 isoform X4 n=1 Tax=Daphnia magna TaxID=35525 RepID=UPI001E1BDA06|nr:uncharacterized protein LOC116922522 isoform X4 [Daphnia magna]